MLRRTFLTLRDVRVLLRLPKISYSSVVPFSLYYHNLEFRIGHQGLSEAHGTIREWQGFTTYFSKFVRRSRFTLHRLPRPFHLSQPFVGALDNEGGAILLGCPAAPA